VRAERIEIEKVVGPYQLLLAQVDEPEVGVETGRDVAFSRQSESVGDIGGGHRHDHRQLEPTHCEQKLPGRLAA
jgi:hypothetical protein